VRFRAPRSLLAGIVAVVALAVASPAAADVPPGFDMFETDPSATVFSFREDFTIPANFFDQGSQPFQGDVNFGGVPLRTFMGRNVGDADTVVRRLAASTPSQPTVPLELVALSLASMAPINVQTAQGVQQWDVQVGPSSVQPSRGEMRIQEQGTTGGMFDSALQVFPRFTFRRLTDGATRTLDLGEFAQNPQIGQQLILRQQGGIWRRGCVLPAFPIPGLNDGFCPGLTPTRRKVLTLEAARLAKHGVYPAQPRLEHFHCYSAVALPTFRPRVVTLRDQFGLARPTVRRPVELCAPAEKNRERVFNRIGHLKCYALSRGPSLNRNVAVRNQFGPARLRVLRRQTLCVPSLKFPLSRRTPPTSRERAALTDHYKCYGVQGRFRRRRVPLRDQFSTRAPLVVTPVRLCTPVQKNRFRVQHPVRHLVCYSLRQAVPVPSRTRRVLNQFGTEIVTTGQSRTLCVPSLKIVLPL
jgi:hypothetical protein